MAAADVVFHDQLVSAEVLSLATPRAELVDVGHRAGGRRRDLSALAERMASLARRGCVVVRLKGGDPFVFGRGGEELHELVRRGVCCEVVPGVSSALAGPAAAGIPVTHRGLSRSVLIVTGHEPSPELGQPWERLRADTVVVLMAAARLESISRQMLEAGWDASIPAAVVMDATGPGQRQVRGCLSEIAARAEGAGLKAPSILVVGQVVSLAGELAAALWAGEGAG